MDMKIPDGKFMAIVKLGEKGQLVIPKPARDMFNLKPNDSVVILADNKKGIAILPSDEYIKFSNSVFDSKEKA